MQLQTIRIVPVIESSQSFVEWWASFDCGGDELERWTRHFRDEGFAKWLAALRRFMAQRICAAEADREAATHRA